MNHGPGDGATATARWTRLRSLFEQVLDVDPAARAAWLERACAGDGELQRELHDLLARDERHEAAAGDAAATPLHRGRHGDTIADFRLLRTLGCGGMGTVYEAEQGKPQRRVALKTLAVPFPSERARRRFEDEAEILARLHHPGIAQVLAAGSETAGDRELPWFAMELVEQGRSLDHFVRDQRLDPRAIAALFLRVGDAVHFAHQRGVIHRDLKPQNVLVDARGQPKVIDFGIARVLADPEARRTRPGELLGTLEYLPPERLLASDDGDTAGDVYALGVMLYELLAGRLPFDAAAMAPAAWLETLRTQEAPPPSRFAARPLPPELDWITLRAMARDRADRYASVAELMRDLEHFLADEPVVAGPPSATYRLRKFARRHRLLLATATTVVLALTIGAAAAAIGFFRAAREARTLREVTTFQERILRGAYGSSRGQDTRLVDVVAQARRDLDARAFGDPDVEIGARNSVAISLLGLGDAAGAARELQRAQQLLRDHRLDPRGERAIAVLHNLAICNEQLGNLELAETESRDALAARLAASGPDHSETAVARCNLASLLLKRGQAGAAHELATAALATFTAAGSDAEYGITARTILAMASAELGHAADTDAHFAAMWQLAQDALDADHPARLAAATSYAGHLHRRGAFPEYLRLCSEIAAARERLQGADHRDTWMAWNNLAAGQLQTGDPATAETTLRKVLAAHEAAGLRDSYENLQTRQNMTVAVRRQGRTAEAEALARVVADTAARVLPAGHWLAGVTRKELGACLRELGQLPAAERELLEAEQLLEAAVGLADFRTQKVVAELVLLYEAMANAEQLAAWKQRQQQ